MYSKKYTILYLKLQSLPKSSMCLGNNHSHCEGFIMEEKILKNFCSCNCHDSSYQLIRNSIAFHNLDNTTNYAMNQNVDY